ncbi:hypothetical protein PDJAM_G00106360 [Pangasius djambal]|uniref:Uncharacterized protein n=1 Tax=Pangasius djambal TaxID=1691987 RepID=A0ACC5Y195_9TELE|nr:hypothetical protein [Pangasius djambal]
MYLLTSSFLMLTVAIKKRSRVPGVIITQYVERIPPGKSTPDFIRKPMAINIQEGKSAIFRAVVTGEPEPTITWARNKGDISDPEKYNTKYDERAGEYTLQFEYPCLSQSAFWHGFGRWEKTREVGGNPHGRAEHAQKLHTNHNPSSGLKPWTLEL